MSSHNYLVIGASRGIGKELVAQLGKEPANHVIATTRTPVDFERNNTENLILDQTDSASVTKAAAKVKAVDTIILNAAIGGVENIFDAPIERFQEYLNTNVLGVHRVVEAFLPALRAGKAKKIIVVSSVMGSITFKTNNPLYFNGPYCVSKAANNMQAIQYHNALKGEGFTVIALHPGWVATEMGNLAGEGAMPVATAASDVIKLVNNLKQEDSGKFFSHDGSNLPW